MFLYHGSKYKHRELKPAFMWTGTEVNWDQTESNHFLYATKARDAAIDMGFASALEQSFLLKRIQTRGNNIRITIESGPMPTREDLEKITVYVYKIEKVQKDGWQAVNNRFNNMSDEFKTDKPIPESSIREVEEIVCKDWLKGRKITVLNAIGKPAWSGW